MWIEENKNLHIVPSSWPPFRATIIFLRRPNFPHFPFHILDFTIIYAPRANLIFWLPPVKWHNRSLCRKESGNHFPRHLVTDIFRRNEEQNTFDTRGRNTMKFTIIILINDFFPVRKNQTVYKKNEHFTNSIFFKFYGMNFSHWIRYKFITSFLPHL